MAFTDAIVSYSSLVEPFDTQDNLLGKTLEVAAKIITDPVKLSSTMSDFATGLNEWQKVEIQPRIFHTPCHPMGALAQSHILTQANLANRIESFLEKIADAVLERFEVRFSADDWLGWAASFFTWIEDLAPVVQPSPSPTAETIANNFNIGVLGDFGTGRYGAPLCQQSIDNSGDQYDLMLHLGDVYYSATEDEVQQRFFRYWPTIGSVTRTMNGNHEMYTGGRSYFGTMLPRYTQPASYFALQNDNWLLAILDTAYFQAFGGQEGVLDDRQMQWLQSIVNVAEGRGVVLLSHHQPFTQLDSNKGGNLLAQLNKYGLENRIFAWYWGHEHRCVLYDPHPQYGFHGRCAGHAAFPQGRVDLGNAPTSPDFGSQWRQLNAKSGVDSSGATVPIPGAWVYDNNNLYVPIEFATQFSPNGFMRLEFSGKQITEYVRTPLNANVWIDTLTLTT